MKFRIMGIDAAFANIGMSLAEVDLTDPANPKIEVTQLELVHTAPLKKRPRGMPRSADDMRRAREALEGINRNIRDWKPDYVVAEVPFGSQSARASWALGIIIGVLASIPDLIEVTPMEVKEATGEKHADKDCMIEWAMDLYPDAPWVKRRLKGNIVQVAGHNEHLADSVAAIHAAINKKWPGQGKRKTK